MKRPHNYYKVLATTETGKALQALMDKCNEVSEQARQWAEKHGASSYIESPEGIAGGIAAVEFATVPDTSASGSEWERVETPHGDVFFLPKEGSDLEKEMYALPVVSETEFINILHFKPRLNSKGKPLPYTFGNETPVVFMSHDHWYVDMPYECQGEDVVRVGEKDFYRHRLSALNQQN